MSSNIYLCSRIRSVIGDRLSRAAQSFMRRHDSGSASPPIRTKRPSPYRLLRSDSFLPAFAPLKDAGWALDTMKSRDSSNESGEEEFADLQDRRLKRVYGFDAGKRGWRDTLEFVAKVGDVVEVEDHHPTIFIAPATDYESSSPDDASETSKQGYVIEISTHTHTPMLSLPEPSSSSGQDKGKGAKIRPGITGKDLKLAEKIEALYK